MNEERIETVESGETIKSRQNVSEDIESGKDVNPLIVDASEVMSPVAGPGVVGAKVPGAVEANIEPEVKTKRTRDEKTIKRQILTNVKKYLADLASKRVEAGEEYSAPTKDQISDECKKRWQEHLDRLKAKEDVSDYFN
jgi:hypothetical protein